MAKVYSLHSIALKAGASGSDFEHFFRKEVEPVPGPSGLTMRLLKGDRGDREGKYLLMFEFESVERVQVVETASVHIKERIMSAENKAVIERLTQAFNEGNLDVLDGLVAANFVGHIPLPPGVLQGVDGLKGFFAAMRAAMPDVRHPRWTLIGEGKLVMIHMPTEGTFTSALMGIPPNGRKVVVWMANIWRLDEGKAVEWWLTMDTLGFMQQLGVIPHSAA
jgi:predicted ester cyclase